ncbi:MAG: FAD-binding oxidoreductase, partial [Acidobacteriota bacterium]
EAGLSLLELNRLFLPRGWASPVMPGTQFVTLGGMVASDVHGKNHHVHGTFGRWVDALRLRLASGDIVRCSRTEHAELFVATLGGMGLTGHILDVVVRLEKIPSAWIWQESERLPDLEAVVRGLRRAAADWEFTVAWIDSLAEGSALGRGILMQGRWAEPYEAPAAPPCPLSGPSVPFDFPRGVLNATTVRWFNQAYYHRHRPRKQRGIVHPQRFFFPLDAIRDWNRVYGAAGFTQYQCVIPSDAGIEAVRRFLAILSDERVASFLTVLKDCGDEGEGLLSFPRPGMSIALDLPMRDDLQRVVDRLNDQVAATGGRIYLTKDALSRATHVRAMEGERLDAFAQVRESVDPEARLASSLSRRVFGS